MRIMLNESTDKVEKCGRAHLYLPFIKKSNISPPLAVAAINKSFLWTLWNITPQLPHVIVWYSLKLLRSGLFGKFSLVGEPQEGQKLGINSVK